MDTIRKDRGGICTAIKHHIKIDTVLKEFWRDNERFADVFNAALFHGKPVIRAEKLQESDTDVSSVLQLGSHTETVQKILDVVKKSVSGIDLAILGLENQQHIHYGMPLRIMLGDALAYLKEYQGITKKNRAERRWEGAGEFLSGFRKEERLHPIITICIYYGEEEWDGPFSLADMLKIPEDFQDAVSDYQMHLVQVRDSENLRFQNPDVRTVFEVSRNIFKKEYGKIEEIYREQDIDSELGIVIGSITDSRELVNLALKRKGGRMNMCTALEELKREGIQEGMQQGMRQGMQQGLKQGIQEGEFQAKREITVALAAMGLSEEQISGATKVDINTVREWLGRDSSRCTWSR